jgi:hypothetical protein
LTASKSDWQLIGCPIAFTTGSLHARGQSSREVFLKLVLEQREAADRGTGAAEQATRQAT